MTVDEYQELFYIDESSPSGLRNKVARGSRAPKDAITGSKTSRGYFKVGCKGKTYLVHRIVYVLQFGEIPENMLVDHRDTDPSNNKVSNLRLATSTQNQYNKGSFRDLPKGIYIDPRNSTNPYKVEFQVGGKLKYFGSYPTVDQAIEVYNKEAQKVHGEFFRPSETIGNG